MTGTEWEVVQVTRVVDGDSLRVVRSRAIELDGRRYRLSDDSPDGVLIRLVWVDTPERGTDDWHRARFDLIDWVNRHALRPLRVVCYESAGWDRLLGDLIDADGQSASVYLMTERGWPPYAGGRA